MELEHNLSINQNQADIQSLLARHSHTPARTWLRVLLCVCLPVTPSVSVRYSASYQSLRVRRTLVVLSLLCVRVQSLDSRT